MHAWSLQLEEEDREAGREPYLSVLPSAGNNSALSCMPEEHVQKSDDSCP